MENLKNILFSKEIGVAHKDERRIIYDPSKLFNGLENRKWHPHNIITIHGKPQLGNHSHPYEELFFTPNGNLKFLFVEETNLQEIAEYTLTEGTRILIPKNVVHRIIGEKGSVLMGWGTEEFDPEKLVGYNEDTKKALDNYMKI